MTDPSSDEPPPPVLGYAEPGTTARPGPNEHLIVEPAHVAIAGGVVVGLCGAIVAISDVVGGPKGAALAAVMLALPILCGVSLLASGLIGLTRSR